jgi:HAD superfamily hydrolase (TIGR01509 family)
VNAEPVVVFDLGNVVIPWDRRRAIARFVDDPLEVERLAEEVFDLEANLHLDRGAGVEEVRAVMEARHPGHGWVVDGYVEHFRHSLGETDPGTQSIIEDLRHAGVRCVGLSNWSAVCFEGIPEDYPVLDLLDGVMISGHEGVCKPEPEIYRRCEERFGFGPDQAIFLDDNEGNVAGALAVGWDALVFTSPATARRELERRGLLTATTGP